MRLNLNPKIWGPKAWFFIESCILSYPDKPTNEDINNFKNFFNSLIYILPCEKCRNNLVNHYKEYPLDNNILNNKDSLLEWFLKIHSSASNKSYNLNSTLNYYKNTYDKKNYNLLYLKYIILILIIVFSVIILLYKFKYIKI